jgi:hypothetical protein
VRLKVVAASADNHGAGFGEAEMRCGRCARAVVEIRVRVGGADLTFRRCGRCDAQAWHAADGEIGLDDVLALARDE